jgi:hypothetical protein
METKVKTLPEQDSNTTPSVRGRCSKFYLHQQQPSSCEASRRYGDKQHDSRFVPKAIRPMAIKSNRWTLYAPSRSTTARTNKQVAGLLSGIVRIPPPFICCSIGRSQMLVYERWPVSSSAPSTSDESCCPTYGDLQLSFRLVGQSVDRWNGDTASSLCTVNGFNNEPRRMSTPFP